MFCVYSRNSCVIRVHGCLVALNRSIRFRVILSNVPCGLHIAVFHAASWSFARDSHSRHVHSHVFAYQGSRWTRNQKSTVDLFSCVSDVLRRTVAVSVRPRCRHRLFSAACVFSCVPSCRALARLLALCRARARNLLVSRACARVP